MGFSRQEYWSGLPFPPPEDFPNPRIEPGLLTLQADALPSEPPRKPQYLGRKNQLIILYNWTDTCYFVILCISYISNMLLRQRFLLIWRLVQFSSVAQSCLNLCDPMDWSMPGLPVHYQLPEFTQTHAHGISDAVQPSHSLFSLLLPPSVFPSIRVFSNESVLRIRWPKYWSFSFSYLKNIHKWNGEKLLTAKTGHLEELLMKN